MPLPFIGTVTILFVCLFFTHPSRGIPGGKCLKNFRLSSNKEVKTIFLENRKYAVHQCILKIMLLNYLIAMVQIILSFVFICI